jgi:fucose permease
MSVVYPTLNSKGISCLPRLNRAAGVILFFTCVSAVLAPLRSALWPTLRSHRLRFWLTGLAALLFIGLILNWALDTASARATGCHGVRQNATA